MSQKSYVKCLECGTLNLNRDYCENCSTIININLKRQLLRDKKNQDQLEEERRKSPNKIEQIFNNASDHSNSIVRGLAKFIHTVWLFIAMVVGALIAGFISIVTG